MSSLSSYPTKAFAENQKILVRDPATGSPSFVLGSDLVSYITPRLNYVRSQSTRVAAENTDYQVGTVVQTTGGEAVGDGFSAVYLVVGSGEGSFPMMNGNELVAINVGISPRNTITSISDIISLSKVDTSTLSDGQKFDRREWWPGTGVGSDQEIWDPNMPVSMHNGGTIKDPAKIASLNAGAKTFGSYFTPDTISGKTGCFVAPDQNIFDITRFGCYVGASASTNGEASQAAFASAGDNAEVTGPRGTYAVDRTLASTSSASLNLSGVVFDASGQDASGFTRGVVTVTGAGDTALPSLSANVSAGDIEVTFSSGHGLSVGDDFLIYNPTDFSFSGWRDYYREGEFCTVASVSSATTVRVEGNLMADHLSSASSLYKMNFAKPSVVRCEAVAPDDASLTIDAIQLRKVAYCDISGLKGSGSNDASIGLENCYYLYGTDVEGSQNINGPAVTMYGMKVSSCQNMNLTGRFAGRRHGCSITGGGTDYTIPNRKITVDGHFVISGAATPGLSAADWHGNTQYCEYRGYCSGGGVNISGVDNRCDVQIDVGANNESIVVSAREVLGLNHDVRINASCYGSPNIRGSIDIGGNSTAVNSDTTRPGVMKISGHLNLPDSTTNAIRCRNSGSTADWTLDVSDLTIQAPNIDRHLRVDAISGPDPKVVSPVWRGSLTLTTSIATDIITQSVTLPWKIMAASSEMIYQLTGYSTSVSGVKLAYGVDSPLDNGFTAVAQTNDGSNFGAVENLKVAWSAQFYD